MTWTKNKYTSKFFSENKIHLFHGSLYCIQEKVYVTNWSHFEFFVIFAKSFSLAWSRQRGRSFKYCRLVIFFVSSSVLRWISQTVNVTSHFKLLRVLFIRFCLNAFWFRPSSSLSSSCNMNLTKAGKDHNLAVSGHGDSSSISVPSWSSVSRSKFFFKILFNVDYIFYKDCIKNFCLKTHQDYFFIFQVSLLFKIFSKCSFRKPWTDLICIHFNLICFHLFFIFHMLEFIIIDWIQSRERRKNSSSCVPIIT